MLEHPTGPARERSGKRVPSCIVAVAPISPRPLRVGRVLALGDDAFEPEVAAVAEDGRTAAFLVELGGWDQPWPGQL
jgi:hypothetical protein